MGRKAAMDKKNTISFRAPEKIAEAIHKIAKVEAKRNTSDWLNIFLTALVEDDTKTIKECLDHVKAFRSKASSK